MDSAGQTHSFEEISMWKTDALKSFLSKRGLPVEGSKDELTALCFSASKLNLPIIPTKEDVLFANKKQYEDNLNLYNIPDPLKVFEGWKDEKSGMASWPPIYLCDITNFFITHLPKEECQRHLNEYKIGKAYEYFHSKWLKEVFHIKHNNCAILRSKCSPSMRIREDDYDVWVCASQDTGEIMSAYCSCTAGLGETCNHIAALLFRVEAANKLGLSACTSLPCTWDVAKDSNMHLQPLELCKATVVKSRHGKENSRPLVNPQKKTYTPVTKLSKDPFEHLSSVLKDVLPNACIFKGKEPPQATSSTRITSRSPAVIFDIKPFSISNLLKECTDVNSIIDTLDNTIYSSTDINSISVSTLGQSSNHNWYAMREGRITSSTFYSVHTKMETLRKKGDVNIFNTVSSVMNYTQVNPNIKALKHGREMEPVAKKVYIKHMNKSVHTNMKYDECGLLVDCKHVFLASSPDLLVSCDCCGDGCLEIKCPMISHCDKCDSFCKCKLPLYLTYNDDIITIRHCHAYYAQMQGQMAISGRKYCDFFVYTCNGFHLERISYDEEFYSKLQNNLISFYKQYVVPEIIDKTVKTTISVRNQELESGASTDVGTEVNVSSTYFCPLCNKIIKESEKIKTYRDKSISCDICDLWFHFKCVKMTQKLADKTEAWLCPKCKDI